ncbi:hypothetical protein J3459_006764 [Metarhizium acridum]|nr:hypothetical protein J3459_006764 [Metarhizium acridum]
MSDPADYTIGWISAFHEYVAAQVFLDDRHERPKQLQPNDENHHVLGTIKDHKVAMAVLPAGQHAVVSASLAATHRWQTFPNLRACLIVSIGRGVSSDRYDIRLGDVVVKPGARCMAIKVELTMAKRFERSVSKAQGF